MSTDEVEEVDDVDELEEVDEAELTASEEADELLSSRSSISSPSSTSSSIPNDSFTLSELSVTICPYPSGIFKIAGVTDVFQRKEMPRSGCVQVYSSW